MADISASMVMELRQRTGLGMMECKKALTEAQRRHGEGRGPAAHQERRQGEQGGRPRRGRRRRSALYVAPDGKHGAMVEVNCETDFVAKNDDFQRVRAASSRSWSRATIRPTSPRCRRATLASGDTVEARARGAGAEDRRERRRAPLRAPQRRPASSRRTCTAPQDRRAASTSRRRRRRSARTSRCTSRRSSRVAVSQGRRRRRDRSSRSARIAAAQGGRIGQAREHRREDGRRRRRTIPRRGHAARPAVRQGRRKQTVEQLLKAQRARR